MGEQEWQYVCGGNGSETVVFLSDGLSGPDAWYVQIERFEPITRVLSIAHPVEANSMADLTDGLEAILQAEKTRQAHLVGTSLGGCLAQCFIRKPTARVSKVVLSNTYTPGPAMGSRIARQSLVFKLLGKWRISSQWMAHLRWVHKGERRLWTAYFQERLATAWSPTLQNNIYACLIDYNRNYQCLPEDVEKWAERRILVIDSSDDPVVGKNERRKMHACYPQALYHHFKYAGHQPHLSRAFEYAETVFEFVMGLQPTGMTPPALKT